MPVWLTQVLTSTVVGSVIGAIVGAWLTRGLQHDLEYVKAQLSSATQLHTSAEQKRADVAAEVLVAVLRLLDALEVAVSGGSFTTATAEERAGDQGRFRAQVREVDAREASVKPYEEEFRRAWHATEVFLPGDVRDLLARINGILGEILAGQRMHAVTLEMSPRDALPFFRQGYGTDPQAKLKEVRDQAKELLRPIAQLGAGAFSVDKNRGGV